MIMTHSNLGAKSLTYKSHTGSKKSLYSQRLANSYGHKDQNIGHQKTPHLAVPLT